MTDPVDTIWITGASGFSGSHFIEYARSRTDGRLVGISASARKTPADRYLSDHLAIDLTEQQQVRQAMALAPPTHIIHLAGTMPPVDDRSLWQGNVDTTWNLLTACQTMLSTPPRILLVGSAAEYTRNPSGLYDETGAIGGNPGYGASKAAQSRIGLVLGEVTGMQIVIARPFNLLGPGLGVHLLLGRVADQLARGESIVRTGPLNSLRDFIDIRDAVAAYWLLLTNHCEYTIYNVCSGTATPIQQVVDLAIESAGTNAVHALDDTFKAASGAERDRHQGSYQRILDEFAWQPVVPLASSVQDTVKTAMAHHGA